MYYIPLDLIGSLNAVFTDDWGKSKVLFKNDSTSSSSVWSFAGSGKSNKTKMGISWTFRLSPSSPFTSIIWSPLDAESITSPSSSVIWKYKQIANEI